MNRSKCSRIRPDRFKVARPIPGLICRVIGAGLLLMQAASAQVSGLVLSAGYNAPARIRVAPGQIITFFVHDLGAQLSGPVRATSFPLPTSLSGISAMWQQSSTQLPVPLLAAEPLNSCAESDQAGCGDTAVTVQIPFNIDADNPTVPRGAPVPGATALFFVQNIQKAAANVQPIVDQVHLLRSCDMVLQIEIDCVRPLPLTLTGP